MSCFLLDIVNSLDKEKNMPELIQTSFFFLGIDFLESLDQSDPMFKPGWKDIFRMNQNELESEIRKVYRDETLDPRRKAYLVQNLMTRLVLIIALQSLHGNIFEFQTFLSSLIDVLWCL